MATKRDPTSDIKQDEENDLKAFTIISGEPRKIDCYLEDGSLKLYWARSKDDLIQYLIDTNDPQLEDVPLSRSADYSHTPSDYHLVLCQDDECPCDKYVMCLDCKATKEALPNEDLTINLYNGSKETLKGDERAACVCSEPKFRTKLEICRDAIDNYFDSDYCFKMLELDVQDPIRSSMTTDDTKTTPKRPKVAAEK
jgi:hypothetical protein